MSPSIRLNKGTIVLVLLYSVHIMIDNGESVIVVLINLSAAFDTVNHELLLSRLSLCYGLYGSVLNWFTANLTNRTQFVNINGTTSTIRHLGVGVPKGSVLGPLLYTLLLLRILFAVIILTFTFTLMIHNYFYL